MEIGDAWKRGGDVWRGKMGMRGGGETDGKR